jgi:hypothetical protein
MFTRSQKAVSALHFPSKLNSFILKSKNSLTNFYLLFLLVNRNNGWNEKCKCIVNMFWNGEEDQKTFAALRNSPQMSYAIR